MGTVPMTRQWEPLFQKFEILLSLETFFLQLSAKEHQFLIFVLQAIVSRKITFLLPNYQFPI